MIDNAPGLQPASEDAMNQVLQLAEALSEAVLRELRY